MSNLKLKTRFQSRLTTALTPSAVSAVIESLTGVPTAPFRIIVDPGLTTEELILVTAVTTTTKTLTIVRAQQGTTGVAHAVDALVYHSELIPGDVPMLVTSKADNATLTPAEAGIILVTVDNKTMTLPAAAVSAGVRYIIKATATHSDGTVVDGNASETIDGAATKTSDAQYSTLDIICDGSNWHVVSYIGTWT